MPPKTPKTPLASSPSAAGPSAAGTSAAAGDPVSVSFETTKAGEIKHTTFETLLQTFNNSFKTIEDLKEWINAQDQSAWASDDPIRNIKSLNKIIKEGLAKHVDRIFKKIQTTLTNGKTISNMDIYDNKVIRITYTDNLRFTNPIRTVELTYQELKSKLNILNTALQNVFNYNELDDIYISQAAFTRAFYTKAINALNMNVSTIRDLYETENASQQCERSYKLPMPDYWGSSTTSQPPGRYDSSAKVDKDWRKYCYICDEDMEEGDGAQCEHILPVFQACAFNCLINKSSNIEDELKKIQAKAPQNTTAQLPEPLLLELKLKKLEYAGAHPCCNSIKSNDSFIIIDPKKHNIVEVNTGAITIVLNNIVTKAITDKKSKCFKLAHLKDWGSEKILYQTNEIETNYIKPLVDELNILLGSNLQQHNFNRSGVIVLFIRINQILAYQASIERTVCSILTGRIKKIVNNIKIHMITTYQFEKTLEDNHLRNGISGYDDPFLSDYLEDLGSIANNEKLWGQHLTKTRTMTTKWQEINIKVTEQFFTNKTIEISLLPKLLVKALLKNLNKKICFNPSFFNIGCYEAQDKHKDTNSTYIKYEKIPGKYGSIRSKSDTVADGNISLKINYYIESLIDMFYDSNYPMISSYDRNKTSKEEIEEIDQINEDYLLTDVCKKYIGLEFGSILHHYNKTPVVESEIIEKYKQSLDTAFVEFEMAYLKFVTCFVVYRSIEYFNTDKKAFDNLFKLFDIDKDSLKEAIQKIDKKNVILAASATLSSLDIASQLVDEDKPDALNDEFKLPDPEKDDDTDDSDPDPTITNENIIEEIIQTVGETYFKIIEYLFTVNNEEAIIVLYTISRKIISLIDSELSPDVIKIEINNLIIDQYKILFEIFKEIYDKDTKNIKIIRDMKANTEATKAADKAVTKATQEINADTEATMAAKNLSGVIEETRTKLEEANVSLNEAMKNTFQSINDEAKASVNTFMDSESKFMNSLSIDYEEIMKTKEQKNEREKHLTKINQLISTVSEISNSTNKKLYEDFYSILEDELLSLTVEYDTKKIQFDTNKSIREDISNKCLKDYEDKLPDLANKSKEFHAGINYFNSEQDKSTKTISSKTEVIRTERKQLEEEKSDLEKIKVMSTFEFSNMDRKQRLTSGLTLGPDKLTYMDAETTKKAYIAYKIQKIDEKENRIKEKEDELSNLTRMKEATNSQRSKLDLIKKLSALKDLKKQFDSQTESEKNEVSEILEEINKYSNIEPKTDEIDNKTLIDILDWKINMNDYITSQKLVNDTISQYEANILNEDSQQIESKQQYINSLPEKKNGFITKLRETVISQITSLDQKLSKSIGTGNYDTQYKRYKEKRSELITFTNNLYKKILTTAQIKDREDAVYNLEQTLADHISEYDELFAQKKKKHEFVIAQLGKSISSSSTTFYAIDKPLDEDKDIIFNNSFLYLIMVKNNKPPPKLNRSRDNPDTPELNPLNTITSYIKETQVGGNNCIKSITNFNKTFKTLIELKTRYDMDMEWNIVGVPATKTTISYLKRVEDGVEIIQNETHKQVADKIFVYNTNVSKSLYICLFKNNIEERLKNIKKNNEELTKEDSTLLDDCITNVQDILNKNYFNDTINNKCKKLFIKLNLFIYIDTTTGKIYDNIGYVLDTLEAADLEFLNKTIEKDKPMFFLDSLKQDDTTETTAAAADTTYTARLDAALSDAALESAFKAGLSSKDKEILRRAANEAARSEADTKQIITKFNEIKKKDFDAFLKMYPHHETVFKLRNKENPETDIDQITKEFLNLYPDKLKCSNYFDELGFLWDTAALDELGFLLDTATARAASIIRVAREQKLKRYIKKYSDTAVIQIEFISDNLNTYQKKPRYRFEGPIGLNSNNLNELLNKFLPQYIEPELTYKFELTARSPDHSAEPAIEMTNNDTINDVLTKNNKMETWGERGIYIRFKPKS